MGSFYKNDQGVLASGVKIKGPLGQWVLDGETYPEHRIIEIDGWKWFESEDVARDEFQIPIPDDGLPDDIE